MSVSLWFEYTSFPHGAPSSFFYLGRQVWTSYLLTRAFIFYRHLVRDLALFLLLWVCPYDSPPDTATWCFWIVVVVDCAIPTAAISRHRRWWPWNSGSLPSLSLCRRCLSGCRATRRASSCRLRGVAGTQKLYSRWRSVFRQVSTTLFRSSASPRTPT